jgi:hypothetical protein
MSADRPSPAQSRGRVLVSLLLLVAGAGLLYWQVKEMEFSGSDFREAARNVGAWFFVVLAISFLRFLLRTVAWQVMLNRPVPLMKMVAATISGDAWGNVIPVGLVASEPAKAIYIRAYVDPTRGLAALLAETFFYSVSVAIYVIVAVAAMFAFFPQISDTVQIMGAMTLSAMATALAIAAWLAWQRPSLASQALLRIAGVRAARLVERLRQFEVQAYGAAGQQGRRLAIVAGCQITFHALSFLECWLIYYLLTGTTALLPALVFDGFNRVVNIVFKPVPGRIGVEETGTALLGAAIGLSLHSAFLLAVVRKVRLAVWAAIGLALWGLRHG